MAAAVSYVLIERTHHLDQLIQCEVREIRFAYPGKISMLNQIHILLRGLDTLGRFLLKRMYDPYRIIKLDSVDRSVSIRLVSQCDFPEARPHPFMGLASPPLTVWPVARSRSRNNTKKRLKSS